MTIAFRPILSNSEVDLALPWRTQTQKGCSKYYHRKFYYCATQNSQSRVKYLGASVETSPLTPNQVPPPNLGAVSAILCSVEIKQDEKQETIEVYRVELSLYLQLCISQSQHTVSY